MKPIIQHYICNKCEYMLPSKCFDSSCGEACCSAHSCIIERSDFSDMKEGQNGIIVGSARWKPTITACKEVVQRWLCNVAKGVYLTRLLKRLRRQFQWEKYSVNNQVYHKSYKKSGSKPSDVKRQGLDEVLTSVKPSEVKYAMPFSLRESRSENGIVHWSPLCCRYHKGTDPLGEREKMQLRRFLNIYKSPSHLMHASAASRILKGSSSSGKPQGVIKYAKITIELVTK